MSTFAKRFVGQLKKPDVDFVNGLSPVVSIDQKTVGSNPRSTVGTMTDISDYLRMLFATMGTPHCPMCGEALAIRTPYQMMEHLLSLPKGTEVEVRAPVYKIHGEDYEYLFEQIRVNGYRRARIDGKPRDLGDHIELDEDEEHTVEAVIDSFVVGPGIDQQVVTSLEHGLKLGDGLLGFHIVKPKQLGAEHKKFYDGFGCAKHRLVAGEMQAFQFTFNDPAGACPTCAGIGTAMRVHPSLLVPDPKRTLERRSVRQRRAEQQPRQLGRPDAAQSRRPLRIQPRHALSGSGRGARPGAALRHEGRAVRSRPAAGGEAGAAARRQEDQVQWRRQSTGASLSPVPQTGHVERRHGRVPEEGDGRIRLPRMRRRPPEARPPSRHHRRTAISTRSARCTWSTCSRS